MPKFNLNKHNPRGHFSLDFNSETKKQFYGSGELNEIDVFRRYGNLPDNGIGVNKLINVFGRNLLNLEEKQLDLKKEYHSATIYNEKSFYNFLERTGNALTIDLLCAMAPLEKEKFSKPVNLEEIKDKVDKVYEQYMESLQKIQTGAKNDGDSLKVARIQNIINTIQNQRAKTKENLNALPTRLASNPDSALRDFYQGTLNDFQDIQSKITFYQRPFLGVAEFANQSNTEAYQNAAYALESHIFSPIEPTKEQLWQIPEGQDIHLSTEQMPGLRKDCALKTAALLSNERGDFLKTYQEQQKAIKTSDIEIKNQSKTAINIPKVEGLNKIKDMESLDKAIKTLSLDQNKYSLQENPIIQYEFSDVFSSVGGVCMSVGKYFEREVAAKHPMVAAGMFLAPGITFAAAGLSSIGIAPAIMNKVVLLVSKFLTANGHLGISPIQMHNAIQAISAEWLHLTGSTGSAFHTLIMDGIGLPKIMYTIADTVLNGMENKDTLTQLAERLCPEGLEGKTRQEKVLEITKNIVVTSFILGTAIGLGLGAEVILKMQTSGVLHLGAKGVESLAHVDPSTFTNLAISQSAGQEVMAIVSMLLTVKSAGLFLGKAWMLVSHMTAPDIQTPDELGKFKQQQEAVRMVGILLDMKDQDQRILTTLLAIIHYQMR